MTNKESIFNHLDEYAAHRKSEIDEHLTTEGLVTSYLIEAHSSSNGNELIPSALDASGWDVHEQDDNFYYAECEAGEIGYLEPFGKRYIAVHSTKKAQYIDRQVKNVVKNVPQLDSTWLSGEYLQELWRNRVLRHHPDRVTQLKFNHESYFASERGSVWERHTQEEADRDTHGREVREQDFDSETGARSVDNRPSLAGSIRDRSSEINRFLPQLQKIHSPFKALNMLRIPSDRTPGGFDFYGWGKMTYRAPTFRTGRKLLKQIAMRYGELTRYIEEKAWFSASTRASSSDTRGLGPAVRGCPIIIKFDSVLEDKLFNKLIEDTFSKNYGPLRLWGNPIKVNSKKYHIYGIDQHLWEQIHLEITPERIKFVLPKGTCGNTVHRLVSNVQKYVEPSLSCFVGEEDYYKLIDQAISGELGDAK